MATDPLDALRLTLMQDLLPVSLAVVERARRGGASEVMAAFNGSASDPLGKLRQEGEPAASQLRDNLDRIQPGLGNPVMKVEVRDVGAETEAGGGKAGGASGSPGVDPSGAVGEDGPALAELQQALSQIGQRLSLLEQRLVDAGAERSDAA